jgi:cell division protein FtsI (penicillin-binding protein 3)
MKTTGHKYRLITVGIFFILLTGALIWRVVDLTVLHRQFLKGQGDARALRVIDMPAYRGNISDRNGIPLAVSTPVQSIWINPKLFSPSKQELSQFCSILGINSSAFEKSVAQVKKREFVYVKRQLPPAIGQKIANLKITGVNLLQEFKRYYPEGDSMAQLLGFTNIDDNGLEGLELAYQSWLMGVTGKKKVLKDRTGRIIEELGVIKSPRAGQPLQLSIDRRIQYLAYHELKGALESYSAKSGSIVVVDTLTGEVLAAANAPSFNPNARGNYTRADYRNKAITDTFEPGSVIKPFTIAAALESGKVKKDTIFDTNPNYLVVQGKVVRDVHNYGVLDTRGVLEKSSNIGVTKMTLLNPPENLINLLHNAGFAERTETGYPGEAEGSMVDVKQAKPFVLATLSFGYGIATTPLQLAKGYMVFANRGQVKPVTLLHSPKAVTGRQIISAKTALDVMDMMESVLNTGTGKLAKVPGYRVAGKTGTARIAGPHGYEAHKHIASFVGIAPVSSPRLVVVVIIQEPHNGYYGGAVAAPLFAKVMGGALKILDIKPDAEG